MSETSMQTRLPNLLVIGVSKGGTSSLFDYLGRHPDVGQSDQKEIRYFTPLRHGEELYDIDDYAQHFAGLTQKYAMEATPGYFYGGHLIADEINNLDTNPRVILSLREPISRCWSWFRFEKSRLRLDKDLSFTDYLDQCMKLHAVGRDGLPENQPYWGVGGGCYARWLPDWVEVFGDRLKVIFFDDLAADPVAVTKDLYQWLDLDPNQADLTNLDAQNQTQLYRIKVLQRAAVKLNRRGEQFFRQHSELKRRLRSVYYLVNRVQPAEQMSMADFERLDAFYAGHNAVLRSQLSAIGLSLPESW